MDAIENPRAVIGGNNPPPSPFETAEAAVERIYGEAVLWMDGATVDNADLADGINGLIVELGKAKKLADETRKIEKKPHDDASKAVQALYMPLIEKCDLAVAACKKALEPWLKKLADEIEAEAKVAREEAEAKRLAAEAAIRARDTTNLAETAAAEALVKAAKKADAIANKAERTTATAGGAMGRATGLRTTYTPVMTDPVLAARHYWAAERQEMLDTLQRLADADVRGGKRTIPGFDVTEFKRAV